MFYLLEKNDFTEIFDYLFLYNKDLVAKSYDLYPHTNEYFRKYDELEGLGYDLDELDDKLLFMRMFVDSIKNIMVHERAFLLHHVPEMNEKSKKMLYITEGLDINKIVVGKYVELYLSTFTDDRMEKELLIRDLLDDTLGVYSDYIFDFNMMIKDIFDTTLFIDSLEYETVRLDETLPEVKDKIVNKYK